MQNNQHEITQVHLQTWKTSYQGILEQTYLDSLVFNAERLNVRTNLLKDDNIHMVVTFNNKVVAFADAGTLRTHKLIKNNSNNAAMGELYAIYVLLAHQGLGLGKQLFQTCSQKLQERNLIPFITWVLKDNQTAIQFYQSLKGKPIDEISSTIGNKQYKEVAYQFI